MQTDPEVRRYVGGRAWSHEEAIQRFRDQYLGKPSDTSSLCATVLKSENRYIGFCGLRYQPDSRSADLFYIARPHWGRGLATEAALAFVNLTFSNLDMLELRADVDHRHEVSQHILRKLGCALQQAEALPNGRIINHYHLHKFTPPPLP